MTNEQALAIIAAYGADARRWPAAQAAGVQALVATDRAVAAAHADAAALDALLADWAGAAVPMLPIDIAGLVPGAAVMPARAHPLPRRWLAGGVLVAAAAAALALWLPVPAAMLGTTRTIPMVPATATTVMAMSGTANSGTAISGTARSGTARSGTASDSDGFADVFTPTVDEDELI